MQHGLHHWHLISRKKGILWLIHFVHLVAIQALFAEDVRVRSPPHVDGLGCTDLIEFNVKECNSEKYIPPIIQSIHPIVLGWQISVSIAFLFLIIGNSLNFNCFQQRIKDVLILREEELLKKKNLSISIDSRIAEIFKSSAVVASKYTLYSVRCIQ